MSYSEDGRSRFTVDEHGNLVFNGLVIPPGVSDVADRVEVSYKINGVACDKPEITKIAFSHWGKYDAFFLTLIDEGIGLDVKVIGTGLSANNQTIPIDDAYQVAPPYAFGVFNLKDVTYGDGIDFNRSTSPDGSFYLRFIERRETKINVEGDFHYSLSYARPHQDFSLTVEVMCNYNVNSVIYPD